MKLTIAIVFAFAFTVILCHCKAYPKDLVVRSVKQSDSNKLETEDVSAHGKDGQKASEANTSAKSSNSESTAEQKSAEGESKQDASKVSTEIAGILSHHQSNELAKKCPDVICAPPPSLSDGTCQTSNDPTLNVMGPIMGPLSECCLLWICTRQDGSFFTHYGVASIKGTEFGNNAASSFSSHFSHGNSYGQNPFSGNGFGNYGASNNFGGPEGFGFHGQQGQPIAAVGFTGQYINPVLPSLPSFQIPFPFAPIQQQPAVAATSTWGVYRGRRDSAPQLQQNFAPQQQQQKQFRQQGAPENVRRTQMQYPQY